ncbi:MAG: PEP-CTERM-box response regulator transcription factor [candidate division Zixibacteria bacterium]|nr:PEP-CTERM-box response regulator transcription factor [candidate division Zixibacteria bacterium]NIR63702.1 PEP-CTERM-box response regulator transcription factor [candidate division Zixibacteria bacterium]NIS14659.1 PEP-CTERM-box response regulator transcription factor [candidate division Zixibacteria bacterium]NIS45658.1 PEP-CTERM-box response regulator transcription factor [candidate division Zixibacteria bacterium]NIT51187.1 PEP-CTERM-box response regulator transcription factor [candidate
MSEERPKILVVDDEEGIRTQIYWALANDYDVSQAADYDSALHLAKEKKPDLVSLDIALTSLADDLSGLKLLQEMLLIDPYLKVIMVTGNEEKETALKSVNEGAYDYYQKPIDLEELKLIVKRAINLRRLELENLKLSKKLEKRQKFNDIIGSSKKMLEVFKLIEAVSKSDYSVLLTGESGTGKELAARAIHDLSNRKGKQFIAINCGAIPENLLESELFGHEKGAFTDAVSQKKGKFEYAHKGTLFLDEIGDLSFPLQVKLLRFLQDQKIERVGGKDLIDLDVRVIAATNADLARKVQEKAFREDLFYRLSVITIDMPPLRERGDDVVLLAKVFLERFAEENKKSGLTFTPGAIAQISEYKWPGNVRELENKIKRAVILAVDKKIKPSDLGFEASEKQEIQPLQKIREETESRHILNALHKNNWNISKTASALGTSRTTLYDLMEKYNIKKR